MRRAGSARGEASGLRESLQAVADQLDARLPHYLLVGADGGPHGRRVRSGQESGAGADRRLAPRPPWLSRVLLAFTIDSRAFVLGCRW